MPNNAPHSIIRPSLDRPLSFQGEAEITKRRSLLPQLGHARYSSRSHVPVKTLDRNIGAKEPVPGVTPSSELPTLAVVKKDVGEQSETPGRLRPRSIYQPVTALLDRDQHVEEASTSRAIRPPTSVSKPPELQTVGLSRTQSLRKPAVSTQSAQSTGSSVHSRTRSIATTMPTRREPAKGKAGSERPRSLLVAPSTNLKPNNVPTDSAASGVRASARIAGIARSVGTKARLEPSSGGAGSEAAQRAEDPPVSQFRRREPVREEPKKTARPAFSTLQQHFTPRKVGKAPTATFLHPAPSSGANSLSPEIVNLQSELLQLHLLHEAAAQASERWESSAKRSLHKKFEEVASLYQAMLEYERTGQEQNNLQALLEWSAGRVSTGLIEHIQILSEPLYELPSLIEPGGRLQRLVGTFEHWILQVQEVRTARHDLTSPKGGLATVEGLGDSWKAENAALIRKLTSFARDLDKLDQPSPGSSIAHIVDTCRSLLDGILDELLAMQTIEAEVVAREKEWVEDRLKAIARDIGAYVVESGPELTPWRS
ncbi:hypothetical protein BKA66DRAFT_448939 [Pyrenochaeta sp. MPI-SDFR-AT-0127]|nr:hypothetical protein BKA66DRAFT_448939 [Pyrenochaeta sp. MPI-SDFR-AT-0127]